jgi:hypothetical protein
MKLKYWDINPLQRLPVGLVSNAELLDLLQADGACKRLPYEVLIFFVKNKENIVNLDEDLLKYFDEIKTIAQTIVKKENMCNNAVKIGSLNLLKAAIENGYPVIKYIDTNIQEHDTFYCAIQHGSLSCIKYLKEIGKFDIDYYYDDFEHYEEIYNIVAEKGYLDVLTYLHKSKFGIEFAKQTFNEDEITDGALWCGRTVGAAAGNGHKHILEYFCENSSWRDPYPTYYAAANGHLECLIYLNENGYHWDSNTCSHATRGGHLNILTYLHEHGCSWGNETCTEAARNGHIDCLMYAHQHGCQMNRSTALSAVMNGCLDCLKYAHEHGCPWDEKICNAAAQNGHLDCLKYAHENGCHWSSETCNLAIRNDHLDCLKYARDNGCDWNKSKCFNLAKGECKQYILEN